MSAIYPTIPLDNRLNKRRFYRQAVTIAEPLQAVVDEFILALSFYPKTYSYKDIYEYFLNKWEATVMKFQFSQKDSVQIDAAFFSNNYKPQI
jgi:hypothetical protein